MPTIQLSDVTIRNLEIPKKGQLTYFDKNLSGFSVRVSQGGTKTYTLVYGTNRKRVTLGRVGIVSLADARKEAKRILAEHTLGKNRPKAIPYDEAKELFLEESSLRNKERTTKDYRRYLELYFKFGRMQLGEITQLEIRSKLDKLNDRPSEKHHAFVTMRRLLRWALNNQHLEFNPMDGLKVPPQRTGQRILAPEELKIVFRESLRADTMFSSIVSLLLLTGQRRSEIASLQWDWIDGELVTLPETKNGRSHTFPVGNQAQKIIKGIPKHSDIYLFPARMTHRRGRPTTTFNSWSKSKKEFDKKLKSVRPYALHDLRRTFSSTLASLGIPIHVTEKILNHVSGVHGGVQGVYNRYSYLDEQREALAIYEKFLCSKF